MTSKKLLFPLIFTLILLFSAFAFAVTENGAMKIYAVTTDGEGLVATLHLEIEPGNGTIWSAVTPLVGTSTQNAERNAVKVAKKFYPNTGLHDYKYTIDSSASVVDGPSAGAAMTLLTVSMLLERPVPDYVSITGTIREDGSVGPVGGVFEKAREASKTGTKLFLIPKGEAVQTVKLPEGVKSVNLIDYAPKTWGLKVAEAGTIDEALKLANSRIEDINAAASQGPDGVPDFVPQKIQIEPELSTFKAVITNYINETKQATGEARNALSSTLLEDPAITHSLLEVLNSAEGTIDKAEILNEQNYLYSAANFAFLARVDATVVKEVSTNPNLIEEDSTALDLKVFELKKELDNFRNDLDENPTKKGIEWLASAQQRYTYAKLAVERLSTQRTIVVDGTEDEKMQVAFERMQDYAFAAEWLGISKDFYEISRQQEVYVKRPNDFANAMDAMIASAEKDINAITDRGLVEDIRRRIDAAKSEKIAGWFEASYFDAASARAMLDSEKEIEGKTEEQLRNMLRDKITQVEKLMADSKVHTGWAELYLDHAKYYLEAADYYSDQNSSVGAADNLKSGYSLALFSENLFNAAEEVNSVYAGLAQVPKQNGNNDNGKGATSIVVQGPNNFTSIAILLLLIALILVLAIMLLGIVHSNRHRKLSILKEIAAAKNKLRQTEEQFKKGRIDGSAHANLMEKYTQELSFLELEREKKAMHILAMDNFSSEISTYKEKMRDLKRHLKEGAITDNEFAKKSKEYLANVQEMKDALHSEIEEISKIDVEAFEGKSAKAMLPAVIAKQESKAQKTKKPVQKPRAATRGKKKRGGAGIRDIAKAALRNEKKSKTRKSS
ncbi:MAG TPA: S16 family serine protease [archaeon]|nr:S16 family serine protease [archaeon]